MAKQMWIHSFSWEKRWPLGRFIPDEYFLFTTAFVDRGSLICENCMYFLIRGGKNISVSRRGKKSVKNHTFYWFLARRTSTVCMKITAFWEMKDDGII